MCWCEQISPLAHSSQGTWQPFNVSHCIEMHNTHLLGRAGQLNQAYFTHSPPILTPRNSASDCQQTMAAIVRIPYVTSHSLQHQPKNGNCRDERYISWYKCSWQVDTTIGPNPILYFYCVKNVEILFEMRFANLSPRSSSNFGETRPRRADRACVKPVLFPVKSRRSLADFNTESIVCCLAQRVIWQFCCIIIKI